MEGMDHAIGATERLELIGKRYKMILSAQKWTGERWTGSEYTTALNDFYWFQGEGKIIDLDDCKETIFTFSTWETRYNSKINLKDHIFDVTKLEYWEKKIQIVETMQPALIDYVCELSLDKNYHDSDIIPHVKFKRMDRKILSEKGFIFEEDGQMRIPDVC